MSTHLVSGARCSPIVGNSPTMHKSTKSPSRESRVSCNNDAIATSDKENFIKQDHIFLSQNNIKMPKNQYGSFHESPVRPGSSRRSPTSSTAIQLPLVPGSIDSLPFYKDRQLEENRFTKKLFRFQRSPQFTAETAEEIVAKYTKVATSTKQRHQQQVQPRQRHRSSEENISTFSEEVRFKSKGKPIQRRATVDAVPQQPHEDHQHRGFRQDYSLGDIIKHFSHMIIERTPKQDLQAVNSLQKHEYAFIRRSDGFYSYAILASRSLVPIKGARNNGIMAEEECMVFVVDEIGSTKAVRQRHWSDVVRLPSMQILGPHGMTKEPPQEPVSDFEPPRMISFNSGEDIVDEISIITAG